jgi:hypothetical protein
MVCYVNYIDEDEQTHRFYTSSTGSVSNLSDDDLDLIGEIVKRFPNFSRRMIDGHLKYLSHCVLHSCVQAAYLRV